MVDLELKGNTIPVSHVIIQVIYIYPGTHGDIASYDLGLAHDDCFEYINSITGAVKANTTIDKTWTVKEFLEINTNTKSVGKIAVTAYAPAAVCIHKESALIKIFALKFGLS